MSFSAQYPKLANFLGAWFPDADLEGLTDSDVVTAFLAVSDRRTVEEILEELQGALADMPLFWEDVANEANRAFDNSESAASWLREISVGMIGQANQ